jgi:hypothetical protein
VNSILLVNPRIYFLIFEGYLIVVQGYQESKYSYSKMDKDKKDSTQKIDNIKIDNITYSN